MPYAFVCRHRQFQVLEDRMLFEYGGLLEFSANPIGRNFMFTQFEQIQGLTEIGGSLIRSRFTCDDVHHCRFSGTVGPDNASELAGLDI